MVVGVLVGVGVGVGVVVVGVGDGVVGADVVPWVLPLLWLLFL